MPSQFVNLNNPGKHMKPVSPDRFNTCVYRSAEQKECSIPSCCGRCKKGMAYTCTKLNIEPLTADKCVNCQEYKAKEV